MHTTDLIASIKLLNKEPYDAVRYSIQKDFKNLTAAATFSVSAIFIVR